MAGVSGKRRIAAFWRHLDLLGNRRKPAQIASKRALDFLGIPWILSFEMSLFNGLWGNFAKKNFSMGFSQVFVRNKAGGHLRHPQFRTSKSARCRACWRRPWISSFANIARNSDFRKQLSVLRALARRRRTGGGSVTISALSAAAASDRWPRGARPANFLRRHFRVSSGPLHSHWAPLMP